MRNIEKFKVNDLNTFKNQALTWAQGFRYFTYFNNNGHTYPNNPFRNILAVGNSEKIQLNNQDAFKSLKIYQETNSDWLIGYLGYDLKNQVEDLESNNKDLTGFPDTAFYRPEHIILIFDNEIEIRSLANPNEVYESIVEMETHVQEDDYAISNVKQLISHDDYISTIEKLREHIIEGDIYEINYCMPFVCEAKINDTRSLYQKLIAGSPTPFSVYQKINNHYLLCASPERFLKKEGYRLVSQPIKGTIKRGKTAEQDEAQKNKLYNSEKERAENMMIVDLVRNDLARSCKPGTVKVDEMFGIYPFKFLFQMISTISGELRDEVHYIDAIKNAFPMGSMTGAPKIKAMQLIEKYEVAKRGLFSGAAGYFTPEGDFDFNVVIRSIFYNANNSTLSFQAGSAITYDSIPQQEYEECMLKVKAILKVLES